MDRWSILLKFQFLKCANTSSCSVLCTVIQNVCNFVLHNSFHFTLQKGTSKKNRTWTTSNIRIMAFKEYILCYYKYEKAWLYAKLLLPDILCSTCHLLCT